MLGERKGRTPGHSRRPVGRALLGSRGILHRLREAMLRLAPHDEEDVLQDAWVAALEKGRGDDPRYRKGCERICRIEFIRERDRYRKTALAWATSNHSVVRLGDKSRKSDGVRGRSSILTVGGSTHLIPMRYFGGEVRHGEGYREGVRARERARYARRAREGVTERMGTER